MRQLRFEIACRKPISTLNPRKHLETLNRPGHEIASRPFHDGAVVRGTIVASHSMVEVPNTFAVTLNVQVQRLGKRGRVLPFCPECRRELLGWPLFIFSLRFYGGLHLGGPVADRGCKERIRSLAQAGLSRWRHRNHFHFPRPGGPGGSFLHCHQRAADSVQNRSNVAACPDQMSGLNAGENTDRLPVITSFRPWDIGTGIEDTQEISPQCLRLHGRQMWSNPLAAVLDDHAFGNGRIRHSRKLKGKSDALPDSG